MFVNPYFRTNPNIPPNMQGLLEEIARPPNFRWVRGLLPAGNVPPNIAEAFPPVDAMYQRGFAASEGMPAAIPRVPPNAAGMAESAGLGPKPNFLWRTGQGQATRLTPWGRPAGLLPRYTSLQSLADLFQPADRFPAPRPLADMFEASDRMRPPSVKYLMQEANAQRMAENAARVRKAQELSKLRNLWFKNAVSDLDAGRIGKAGKLTRLLPTFAKYLPSIGAAGTAISMSGDVSRGMMRTKNWEDIQRYKAFVDKVIATTRPEFTQDLQKISAQLEKPDAIFMPVWGWAKRIQEAMPTEKARGLATQQKPPASTEQATVREALTPTGAAATSEIIAPTGQAGEAVETTPTGTTRPWEEAFVEGLLKRASSPRATDRAWLEAIVKPGKKQVATARTTGGKRDFNTDALVAEGIVAKHSKTAADVEINRAKAAMWLMKGGHDPVDVTDWLYGKKTPAREARELEVKRREEMDKYLRERTDKEAEYLRGKADEETRYQRRRNDELLRALMSATTSAKLQNLQSQYIEARQNQAYARKIEKAYIKDAHPVPEDGDTSLYDYVVDYGNGKRIGYGTRKGIKGYFFPRQEGRPLQEVSTASPSGDMGDFLGTLMQLYSGAGSLTPQVGAGTGAGGGGNTYYEYVPGKGTVPRR